LLTYNLLAALYFGCLRGRMVSGTCEKIEFRPVIHNVNH